MSLSSSTGTVAAMATVVSLILLAVAEASLVQEPEQPHGVAPAAAAASEKKVGAVVVVARKVDDVDGSSSSPSPGGGEKEAAAGRKKNKQGCFTTKDCHMKRVQCAKKCTLSAHNKCAAKCSKSCVPTSSSTCS